MPWCPRSSLCFPLFKRVAHPFALSLRGSQSDVRACISYIQHAKCVSNLSDLYLKSLDFPVLMSLRCSSFTIYCETMCLGWKFEEWVFSLRGSFRTFFGRIYDENEDNEGTHLPKSMKHTNIWLTWKKIKIFEIKFTHIFFRVLISSPPFVTHHQSQFRLVTPRHTG